MERLSRTKTNNQENCWIINLQDIETEEDLNSDRLMNGAWTGNSVIPDVDDDNDEKHA